MPKEHRLEKRGRIYYLRVIIPASIRHLYGVEKAGKFASALGPRASARHASAVGMSARAWSGSLASTVLGF